MNKINNLLGIIQLCTITGSHCSDYWFWLIMTSAACQDRSSFVSLIKISFNRHFNNYSYSTIFSVTDRLKPLTKGKKPSGLRMNNSCTEKRRTNFNFFFSIDCSESGKEWLKPTMLSAVFCVKKNCCTCQFWVPSGSVAT